MKGSSSADASNSWIQSVAIKVVISPQWNFKNTYFVCIPYSMYINSGYDKVLCASLQLAHMHVSAWLPNSLPGMN